MRNRENRKYRVIREKNNTERKEDRNIYERKDNID